MKPSVSFFFHLCSFFDLGAKIVNTENTHRNSIGRQHSTRSGFFLEHVLLKTVFPYVHAAI